jgi:hypothetical protein
MSDNRYRVGQFKRGQPVTAHNLNRLKEAARATPLRRNPFGRTSLGASGQNFTPYPQKSNNNAGSLVWAVSQDPINTFGQSGIEPGEPLEVLEEGVFYLSTPWGTRVGAPNKLYGFWNKIGDNYYFPVRDIFIEIDEVYPSSGNVTNYKIKFAKSTSSLTLGDTAVSGSLPSGAEATLETYDNANSSLDARSVFNGNVYDCSFDPAQNLFFIDHPVVG